MARCRRNVSTACEASAVTGLWSLRATCSAGSSPNTFGSANSVASSSTAATRMYFQRAYSSISGALQGALGHQLGDLDLLHLDAHAVGDLEGNEGVANIGDPAEQASGGHHLIPRGELRHERLVLLGALLLRADQHEIKQRDERRHEQRELELAAGGAGCRLRPGVGDQGIHVSVREAKRAALCHSTGGAPGGEESAGPGREPPGRDGGAQRTHEPDVEVQVVNGVEP